MRASEILRKLADVIDGQTVEPGAAEQTQVDTGDMAAVDGPPTMVAPLQQKIELLKKIAGIDNMYSNEEPESEEVCNACGEVQCGCGTEEPDELEVMRNNAGIKIAAFELGDDEPYEG